MGLQESDEEGKHQDEEGKHDQQDSKVKQKDPLFSTLNEKGIWFQKWHN